MTEPAQNRTGAGGSKAYDLHLHTNHSLDAFTSVNQLLAIARRKNIGIAVTDHNEIRGSVEAMEKAHGVEVIPAIEVKARSGVDIMVYFETADDMIGYYRKVIEPKRQGLFSFIPDLREREIVDGAREFRCILSSPHPYALHRMGLAGVTESGAVRKDLLERMDLIETCNAMMPPSANHKARELATALGKPVIGGSDAHLPQLVGTALTITPAGRPLFEALRAGKTSAMGGGYWYLLSAATFIAGQMKIACLPNGWNLLRRNIAVFHDDALRDGSQPEPAIPA